MMVKDWDGASELYKIQQGNFDQMLRNRLGAYYAHPGLTFALAVTSLIAFSGYRRTFLFSLSFGNLIDISGKTIDSTSLGLLDFNPYDKYGNFYQYLCQFLTDSSRSGQY